MTQLSSLNREDRLRLMRFVCSFAWADLEVRAEEREFVGKLVKKLKLQPEEVQLVEGWLEVPPRAEEVDPTDIPPEHRRLFIDAARAMVVVDGDVDREEAENLALLEHLMR